MTPQQLPYAGKRKLNVEYDIVAHGGKSNTNLRSLHNSDDPVIPTDSKQRNAVSQRTVSAINQFILPKKSLREQNLEKQRLGQLEQDRFPGLAGKIHNSPSRFYESSKLQNTLGTYADRIGSQGSTLDLQQAYFQNQSSFGQPQQQ